jgi:hypothetical protein
MLDNTEVPENSQLAARKGTNKHTLNIEFDDSFLEEIHEHVGDLDKQAVEASNRSGVFVIKSANSWIEEAKIRQRPKMLWHELWHQNEICCLFASSNVGKSILAMVIANHITKGYSEAEKQMVLYLDFELSPKQFEGRYSDNYTNHYQFSELLYRLELHSNILPEGKTFEEMINESMEAAIVSTGARILIIDNLTYLRNETEKSKEALTLMKYLKALKSKYDLSLLILAHTPKRDFSRPLTLNDLSGSSMLGNFFDSAFTIGASHTDKSIRYIKQIKARETEIKYDSENVMIYQIVKHMNFLDFEFSHYGAEREHLKEVSDKDRNTKIEEVKELSTKGMSQRDISRQLNIGLSTVNKYLKL